MSVHKVVLWLSETEFNQENLPDNILHAVRRGLELRFCPDWRSYKKLVPTLSEWGHMNIITADDDVLYPSTFVEGLLKGAARFPEAIIAYRGHRCTFSSEGQLLPYDQWQHCVKESDPSDELIATGAGGIYYPANSLSGAALEHKLFMSLAPSTDDLWFKCMALLKGTKVAVIDDLNGWSRYPSELFESSQRDSLYSINCKGENDRALARLFKHFDLTVSARDK
ncbi:hypothetical protein [Agaribacterium haliotis]|uniref:hypothetical protein n=1 Tax=Agaribacterium haliotis TaxID=2013869 RepID=UPI0011773982|nr:hypothetical protein [Agaribacterium haliotis]